MDAEQYRAYWAALTGRNPRDVYVPDALAEWGCATPLACEAPAGPCTCQKRRLRSGE